MITAKLHFKDFDIDQVLKLWQKFPEPIKPIYFSEDEGKVFHGNLISNEKKFFVFKKNNPLGFFLHAENKTYFDISKHSIGFSEVSIYLKDRSLYDFLAPFFLMLVPYDPLFGYACEWDEYVHRNRYQFTIGKNHIEDWIGRKLEYYIPGIYWHTLLSNKLLAMHKVKLSDLSSEAISAQTLGNGSFHLLKFFEKPEEWIDNAERLDNLCEKIDGVFSKRSVESAVSGISNYLEYDQIIAEWR